ncbi:nucleoside 2-deoxyribosyltransferase domain-containing protein [Streptomyces sp. APSN-46.1]|uniref:nucleoside 2-deoxyribosyltransferase domain-containing protein n=1 Tax=Streptomyces sp. APSN-46.1 TaxID=2929049 RepID=UPI001FB2C8B6|nr:nucleoside 2-deoxyribosyltransferase domain-containing protein [Streptomyces sp. APSN-46.1]MCJ1675849.1 nucleoside 2-deoxyribosyltransferase domain-containing protein [Streptomyces sp. APSN-46.1]
MRYIEAPADYERDGTPSLFLAGGITGCPDWQSEAVRQLEALGCPVTVVSPRRARFPVGDAALAPSQIAWEFTMLHRAEVILFWFPDSTTSVQPIVLYELGAHAARGAAIAVGADPAYVRRLDVVEQLRHARPDVHVHDDLHETVRAATDLLPTGVVRPS